MSVRPPSEAATQAARGFDEAHMAETMGDDERSALAHAFQAFAAPRIPHPIDDGWPAGISNGLARDCWVCGERPRFAFLVTDEFWRRWIPPSDPAHADVLCLPCLDARCRGEGLAEALLEIQWTGTGHTVALEPTLIHRMEQDG